MRKDRKQYMSPRVRPVITLEAAAVDGGSTKLGITPGGGVKLDFRVWSRPNMFDLYGYG